MLWCLRRLCVRNASNARVFLRSISNCGLLYRGRVVKIFQPKGTLSKLLGERGPKVRGVLLRQVRLNQTQGQPGGNEQNGGKGKGGYAALVIWGVGLATFVVYYIQSSLGGSGARREVPVTMTWKQFAEGVLPSGEVRRIHIYNNVDSHTVQVDLQPGASFDGAKVSSITITGLRDVNRVEKMVRDTEKEMGINPMNRIPIVYHLFDPKTFFLLGAALLLGMIALYYLNVRMEIFMNRGNGMLKMMSDSATRAEPTGIKFADVSGCAEAKQEVMEFVHYLKQPERYEQLGAKMPRGCLLTGPPGVGKTLLAKAVATEAEVPFLSKAGSDFVEMVGGLGARRVRDLFKEARSLAPCIIYVDELDAVGGKRSDSSGSQPGSSEKDQTLNQILVEMDGMLSADYKVVVMGSTNRADMLDKALLRPGRFDRHIAIDLPTRSERVEIFEQHLKGLKLLKKSTEYSDRLSMLTPGMSGADIANICNEAAIYAAREKDPHIDSKHFEYAVERIIGGSARKTTSLSPSERNIIAVHEAGHVLVGWLLKHTDALIKVSIVPRTKTALGFVRTLASDRYLFTQAQLSDIMCMTLAGRAAENLVFGTVTQGAQDDLKKVTDMAYAQVKNLGFSPAVGHLSFAGEDESYVKPYSDALASIIDHEVGKMINSSHRCAEDILKQNRDKLDLISGELLKREVLNYADIVELVGKPPYGDKVQVERIDTGPSYGKD